MRRRRLLERCRYTDVINEQVCVDVCAGRLLKLGFSHGVPPPLPVFQPLLTNAVTEYVM